MASFLLALTFSILLTLVFVIPGLFLFGRWFEILGGNDQIFAARVAILVGDMKVPTFYAMNNDEMETLGFLTFFPVVGVIFGGIHCAGWFFDFPSSDEAMLWRVSSAVLTVSAVLIPLVMLLLMFFLDDSQFKRFGIPVVTIFLLVYVVSRLFLLVEAFISLRHLTPGMLALVKWTSFIPHLNSLICTQNIIKLVTRIRQSF